VRKPTAGIIETPVRDAGGNIVGAISIGEDVTERKQMEAQLGQQLYFATAITTNLAEGVYSLYRAGHLTFMNQASHLTFMNQASRLTFMNQAMNQASRLTFMNQASRLTFMNLKAGIETPLPSGSWKPVW